MRTLRSAVTVAALLLASCAQNGEGATVLEEAGEPSVRPLEPSDAREGAALSEDVIAAEGDDASEANVTLVDTENDADDSSDARLEGDLGPLDSAEPADRFAGLTASCDLTVHAGDELRLHLEATYEGYKENVFGAAIYGHMLKIWVSNGEGVLELLIRMDQTTIPGEFVPGVPGDEAWIVMMIGEESVLSTMPPSGLVSLTSCPDAVGVMLAGTVSDVTLFDMGDMTPITVNGSFEVVLGDLEGEAICGGL